jgi:RNA polymerase sigma factor (sigma-70 family)
VEAWDRFHRLYSPLLHRFALACGVSPADLDDCLQEVWADLVGTIWNLHYDPRRGRFQSWLYVLVHSKATDLVRRRSRHPTQHLCDRLEAAFPSPEADPAATYERHGRQRAVQRVLDVLRRHVSLRSYRVLHMRSIDGCTVSQTAAALALTPGQVRSRHHRMKQKFRRLFELYTRSNFATDGGS